VTKRYLVASSQEGEVPPPLRAMWELVELIDRKVIGEDEACQRVRDQPWQLSEPDTEVVASAAVSLVVNQNAPDAAYWLALLLLEAAQARWGARMRTPWWLAADIFVEVTRLVLVDTPNGRWLRRACGIADEQIRQLREAGELDELAETMYVAGILRIHPQLGGAVNGNPHDAYHRWRAREQQRQMVDSSHGMDDAAAQMPDVIQAACESLIYLHGAAGLSSGHIRGRCLIGVLEAFTLLQWFSGHSPALQQLARTYANEAMTLLDPSEDPGQHITLLAALFSLGEVTQFTDLMSIIPVPLEELDRRYGRMRAQAIVSHAMTLLRNTGQINLERELTALAEETFPDEISGELRSQIWMGQLHRLPRSKIECPSEHIRLPDFVAELRRRAQAERWRDDDLADTLTHLAAHAEHQEDLPAACDLLEEAMAAAPRSGDIALGRQLLLANLTYEDAHNRMRREEYLDAEDCFFKAALIYAELDRLEAADDCLLFMTACAADAGFEGACLAAVGLATVAPWLRASLDETRSVLLHSKCQTVATLLAQDKTSPSAMLTLHQAAKGLDFGIAQAIPGPRSLWPDSKNLLTRVMAAETDLDRIAAAGSVDETFISRELLMLCYAGMAEQGMGQSLDLANLQRAYDREVSSWLLNAGVSGDAGQLRHRYFEKYLDIEKLQRLLPAETVLVSPFLGYNIPRGEDGRLQSSPVIGPWVEDTENGTTAVHVLAVASDWVETRFVSIENCPVGVMRLKGDKHSVSVHPIAPEIAGLLSDITADPLHRVVSREAEEELNSIFPSIFGGLIDRLNIWRAQGKHHLCIWPHGPLHYLPFHLLRVDGRLIADDWTVTILPSLHLLNRDPTSHIGHGLVAAASAGGGATVGFDREDSLESHATEVAQIAGGTAITGTSATPTTVTSAMAHARYLHLAAHGSHNEVAPWFQCLYLAADQDGEGRLFAHDLLGVDLRGVELVTLSSCESALGRFDINDNLRGLPAALFVTGATTVVGCLWQVHPDVATQFFAALHRRLRDGLGKLVAFREAQNLTRSTFPNYRDWGAFCLIGDWRDRTK
jgi:hypothetical protein